MKRTKSTLIDGVFAICWVVGDFHFFCNGFRKRQLSRSTVIYRQKKNDTTKSVRSPKRILKQHLINHLNNMWHKSEWSKPPSDNSMQDGVVALSKDGNTFNVAVGDVVLFKAFYGVGPHRDYSSPHIVLGKIDGFSSSRSNNPSRLHYVPWREETRQFANHCFSRAGIVLWPHGVESYGIHPEELVKVEDFDTTAAAAYRYNLDSDCKVLEQAFNAAEAHSKEQRDAFKVAQAVIQDESADSEKIHVSAFKAREAEQKEAELKAAVIEAKARLEKAGGEVPSESFFGFSHHEQPEQPVPQPEQPVAEPVAEPVQLELPVAEPVQLELPVAEPVAEKKVDGIQTSENGDMYYGELKNNLPNGKGIMAYSNGNLYHGDLEDGLPHGRGKMYYYNNSPAVRRVFVKRVPAKSTAPRIKMAAQTLTLASKRPAEEGSEPCKRARA
jgi:hypothetical protein